MNDKLEKVLKDWIMESGAPENSISYRTKYIDHGQELTLCTKYPGYYIGRAGTRVDKYKAILADSCGIAHVEFYELTDTVALTYVDSLNRMNDVLRQTSAAQASTRHSAQACELCNHCPAVKIFPDPDPHDSFNRDDETRHCGHVPDDKDPRKFKRIEGARRPYEKTNPPSWCPLGFGKEEEA